MMAARPSVERRTSWSWAARGQQAGHTVTVDHCLSPHRPFVRMQHLASHSRAEGAFIHIPRHHCFHLTYSMQKSLLAKLRTLGDLRNSWCGGRVRDWCRTPVCVCVCVRITHQTNQPQTCNLGELLATPQLQVHATHWSLRLSQLTAWEKALEPGNRPVSLPRHHSSLQRHPLFSGLGFFRSQRNPQMFEDKDFLELGHPW